MEILFKAELTEKQIFDIIDSNEFPEFIDDGFFFNITKELNLKIFSNDTPGWVKEIKMEDIFLLNKDSYDKDKVATEIQPMIINLEKLIDRLKNLVQEMDA